METQSFFFMDMDAYWHFHTFFLISTGKSPRHMALRARAVILSTVPSNEKFCFLMLTFNLSRSENIAWSYYGQLTADFQITWRNL